MIPIKPENNTEALSVVIPESLKHKLKQFAEDNDVSQGQAVRHILSLFFDSNFGKSKAANRNSKN